MNEILVDDSFFFSSSAAAFFLWLGSASQIKSHGIVNMLCNFESWQKISTLFVCKFYYF